jgi:hypothetical protein
VYFFSTMIIQPTPNRSATRPNRRAKNISPSGICTFPPSARAREHAIGYGLVFGVDRERKALEFGLALGAAV